MKILILFISLFMMGAKNMNSIELEQVDGKKITLESFKGKPVLVVT